MSLIRFSSLRNEFVYSFRSKSIPEHDLLADRIFSLYPLPHLLNLGIYLDNHEMTRERKRESKRECKKDRESVRKRERGYNELH